MRFHLALPAAVVAVLATAAGAGNALSQAPQNQPLRTRSQTYLEVTQNELAATGHHVDSIALTAQTAGVEVYLLDGPTDQCLLIAGAEQPDGHSIQLACTRDVVIAEGRPLATTVSLPSRKGARLDIAPLPTSATEVSMFNETTVSETTVVSTKFGVAVGVQGNEEDQTRVSWDTEQGRRELHFEPNPVPARR